MRLEWILIQRNHGPVQGVFQDGCWGDLQRLEKLFAVCVLKMNSLLLTTEKRDI